MGLLKNWQGRQWWMHSVFAKWFGWIGWLPIALSQLELSEAVTGSVSFLDAGVTSLGHVAAFTTSFFRGRLDLEMGARDVLATIRGPKLEGINGFGLTTDSDPKLASVVMLSTYIHNSSLRQFMKYISNSHNVDSILLQCLPLRSAAMTVEICECRDQCQCLIFWTIEDVTILLALRMPGILKQLSPSLCLLPSLQCLSNGCHGCNEGLLHVEIDELAQERLIEGDSEVGFPAAVCETLDIVARSVEEKPTCICIPVLPALRDDWTRLLITSFKCKDEESRGAGVPATEALESYLGETRAATAERVTYSNASIIVPRFIELSLNVVLTGWFRVDGFSSSLIARRAIRDYVVDSRGNGFVANVFLKTALVNASATTSHICQVLTFRRNLISLRNFAFVTGGVNFVCSVWWSLAIAFGVGLGKWSDIYSMPPSKPRFFAIMAALGIGLGMDSLHLYLNRFRWRELAELWTVIILEILCIVAGSTVAGVLGVKAFGTWLYSALQCMVWVKWGFGSYLLGEYLDDESRWAESGILVYSSAFLLSAILAGVGGKWE
eukprot:Gb_27443 [translate_table: standard]